MTEIKVDVMVEVIQEYGYTARIYEDYSGRGMYGSTTIGVVTELRPLEMKQLLWAAHIEDEDFFSDEQKEALRALADGGYRTDNMGLDYIYY